jgi:hypothetical protein
MVILAFYYKLKAFLKRIFFFLGSLFKNSKIFFFLKKIRAFYDSFLFHKRSFFFFLSHLKSSIFFKRLFLVFYNDFYLGFIFSFFYLFVIILELVFFAFLLVYFLVVFVLYSIKFYNISCLFFDYVVEFLLNNDTFNYIWSTVYVYIELYLKYSGLLILYKYLYSRYIIYTEAFCDTFFLIYDTSFGYDLQLPISYLIIQNVVIVVFFYYYYLESLNAIANPFAFHLRKVWTARLLFFYRLHFARDLDLFLNELLPFYEDRLFYWWGVFSNLKSFMLYFILNIIYVISTYTFYSVLLESYNRLKYFFSFLYNAFPIFFDIFINRLFFFFILVFKAYFFFFFKTLFVCLFICLFEIFFYFYDKYLFNAFLKHSEFFKFFFKRFFSVYKFFKFFFKRFFSVYKFFKFFFKRFFFKVDFFFCFCCLCLFLFFYLRLIWYFSVLNVYLVALFVSFFYFCFCLNWDFISKNLFLFFSFLFLQIIEFFFFFSIFLINIFFRLFLFKFVYIEWIFLFLFFFFVSFFFAWCNFAFFYYFFVFFYNPFILIELEIAYCLFLLLFLFFIFYLRFIGYFSVLNVYLVFFFISLCCFFVFLNLLHYRFGLTYNFLLFHGLETSLFDYASFRVNMNVFPFLLHSNDFFLMHGDYLEAHVLFIWNLGSSNIFINDLYWSQFFIFY